MRLGVRRQENEEDLTQRRKGAKTYFLLCVSATLRETLLSSVLIRVHPWLNSEALVSIVSGEWCLRPLSFRSAFRVPRFFIGFVCFVCFVVVQPVPLFPASLFLSSGRALGENRGVGHGCPASNAPRPSHPT